MKCFSMGQKLECSTPSRQFPQHTVLNILDKFFLFPLGEAFLYIFIMI